tara:strand:+ start:190 stop:402 length:213 start_codon:yes stop_codon:yes gene_type:complete
MKDTFKSLLRIFDFKVNTNQMTIAELNDFNFRKEKIEKKKKSRAYISEINQRYRKMRKRENNLLRKGFLF